MGPGGWEAQAASFGGFLTLCLALSGILLDAILANFSRVQRLGLPLKMVMYSAVSLRKGRQCHVGTGMGRGWDLGEGGLMVPVEPQPHALSNTYLQTILSGHITRGMKSGRREVMMGKNSVLLEGQAFWLSCPVIFIK